MKKSDRLLKVADNFCKIEIYLESDSTEVKKQYIFCVLVSGRVFSGSYEIIISAKKLRGLYSELQHGKNKQDSLKSISFISDYRNLSFSVEYLGQNKIKWRFNLQALSTDIETLKLVLETEAALLNSLVKNLIRMGFSA